MRALTAALFQPGPDRRTIESPSFPLTAHNILTWIGAATPTEAGIDVSPGSAMRLAAVWACIRVRGEALAALPWDVYERTPAGGRRQVRDHPLSAFLRDMVRRETHQAHVDAWGNGYLEAKRSSSGELVELRVLAPDSTTLERGAGGSLFYLADDPETGVRMPPIPARNMVHTAGLSWDGLRGISVLRQHADTVGYALSARRAGSRLLANDSRPLGIIKTKAPLQKDGFADAVRERFEAQQIGGNRGRVAVLGADSEYQAVGLPPSELEFVEQMEWGLLDIARIYLVPPHKIGYLKDAGDRANIEHENLRFATDVLVPAARRLELAHDRVLLSVAEQDRGLFTRIDLRGMLRGDFKTRMEGYAIARTNGLKNADEIRALEDEEPIGGRAGQAYLVPLNLTDASLEPAPPPEPAPAPDPDDDDDLGDLGDDDDDEAEAGRALLSMLAPVFADAGRRVAERERQELVAVAHALGEGRRARALERFGELLTAGAARLERAFAPALAAAGIVPGPEYWAGRAAEYEARRRRIAEEITRAGESLLAEWPDFGPELAEREARAAAEWKQWITNAGS